MAFLAIPAVAAGIGLAGTAVAAGGTFLSYEAQSANAAYLSQVSANNAAIAKQNANWDIASGDAAAANEGLKTAAKAGAQTANLGAAGVTPNTGTAANVTAATKAMGMLDALTLRSNAARQAYGQKVAATSEEGQSQLQSAEAEQAGIAGPIASSGSLLEGVSTVGARYNQAQLGYGNSSSTSIG